MRPIWKGHIRFSLVTIPICIYNAIESSETISFKQLHKDDNGPIGYDKRCKKCSKIVKNEDIVKGYQYEPDQFAIIEPEDLAKLKLKSTKVIEIEGFVDSSEVHPTLYDTPYYAGPDGDVAAKTFALLCATLEDSGKLGIGKVVIRDRESVVLLSPEKNGLLLYKLRYPNEVRKISEVPKLNGLAADKQQLKLARTLVDSMVKPFSEIKLKDTYKDAVKELIKAKIEGKEIVTLEEEEKPVVDIMTALKKSIDNASKQKKPMKKATGTKAAEVVKPAKAKKRKAS
ncbi:MAG: Ku protein [Chlorobi bacterium]|nr:Ku protein [Chlorobiota bacterium]MCI0715496.1 Ku protein [Chlorobiota bacterium]